MPKCSTCGTELIQKSRPRLFLVGLLLCASPLLAIAGKIFWIPGIILALAGGYLMVWATLGKGRWCRTCKSMRIS
jgi:hypothetical protein